MNGLFVGSQVLETRTAVPVDEVVVAETMAVVSSGVVVVKTQSNSVQGQPAEQFSLNSYRRSLKLTFSLLHKDSSAVFF